MSDVAAKKVFNAGAEPLRGDVVWRDETGKTHHFDGPTMTARVAQIASVLWHLGVRPGDRVVVLLFRRPANWATAMAIWRIGAICVPISHLEEPAEIAAMIDDAEPRCIVVDARTRVLVNPTVMVLMASGEAAHGEFSVNGVLASGVPDAPVAMTHRDTVATLSYVRRTGDRVLHGVMLRHAAVHDFGQLGGLIPDSESRHLVFSGADAGRLYGILPAGISLLLAESGRVLDQQDFSVDGWLDAIARTGADVLVAAAPGLEAMYRTGRQLPESLRGVISAGVPYGTDVARWLMNSQLWQRRCFGSVECGVVLATDSRAAMTHGSLGFPVGGARLGIFGSDGHPVDGAGTGNLAVFDEGRFPAIGYWNQRSDWLKRQARGWFVTDDIVRRDAVGQYFHVEGTGFI